MTRPDGGWISGYAAPTHLAARGLWSQRDLTRSARSLSWPRSTVYDNLRQFTLASLHFDGANGSTTITDSGPAGRTGWSVSGATTSTAQSRFGGVSLSLPTTAARVTLPLNTAFNLTTGDWTLEFWVWLSSTAAGTSLLGVSTAYGTAAGMQIWIASGPSLGLYASSAAGSWNVATLAGMGAIAAQSWTHVVLCRGASLIAAYVNGTRSLVIPIGLSTPISHGGSSLVFGGTVSHIDEFRHTTANRYFINGVPPPTITVPTAALAD
jgi:hypothetical protein